MTKIEIAILLVNVIMLVLCTTYIVVTTFNLNSQIGSCTNGIQIESKSKGDLFISDLGTDNAKN